MQPVFKKSSVVLLAGLMMTFSILSPFTAKWATAAEDAPTGKPKIWLGTEIEVKAEPQDQKNGETSGKPGWFKRNRWWVLLGSALIAGTAAALALNGDDDGDSEENGYTGVYETTW